MNFKFILLSINLIFPPKISLPKYRFLATLVHESVPKTFRCLAQFISIIKGDRNIYLSKRSWNINFCLPSNHQYGSHLVSKHLIVFFPDLKNQWCYNIEKYTCTMYWLSEYIWFCFDYIHTWVIPWWNPLVKTLQLP